ncbi:MAG: hypothetical protein M3N45_06630 [Actinomycetota bacterium]|nr:hypothetical protein [Actinomycetota bacterium]
MIKSSDSFGVDALDAPRFSAWETRKAAVVVHGIRVSLKRQRSALGSTDALVACAVEKNTGCTTHGGLSPVIEEAWQRAEREHESVYTSTYVASASAHPVEEQK